MAEDWETQYSDRKIHLLGQEPAWVGERDWNCDGKTVLDLGSGEGLNSFYLRKRWPAARIISVDISHIRCTRCRKNTGQPVVQCDCCVLAIRSSSVDFVVSTMVIEHVPEDMALIREIDRVLKPGGRAFISTVIRKRFGIYFYRNKDGKFMLDPTHLREYGSASEFESLFEGLLKIVRSRTSRISFSPARFVYRFLYALNLISNPDSTYFQKNRFLKLLSGITVSVPRYRQIEVDAVKNNAQGKNRDN